MTGTDKDDQGTALERLKFLNGLRKVTEGPHVLAVVLQTRNKVHASLRSKSNDKVVGLERLVLLGQLDGLVGRVDGRHLVLDHFHLQSLLQTRLGARALGFHAMTNKIPELAEACSESGRLVDEDDLDLVRVEQLAELKGGANAAEARSENYDTHHCWFTQRANDKSDECFASSQRGDVNGLRTDILSVVGCREWNDSDLTPFSFTLAFPALIRMATTLSDIPNEILGVIFSHLTQAEVFWNMRVVCKEWNRVTYDPQWCLLLSSPYPPVSLNILIVNINIYTNINTLFSILILI